MVPEMKIRLMEDSITEEDLESLNACLKSKNYTQGKIVEEFEKKFAEWNSSKYAIMVNSGSSADLLMIDLLKQKFNFKQNDEILVPLVTWPTAVYPIIQNSITPVFCDVDDSFNISLESIKKMKTDKTRAIFVTHLLGQPAEIDKIKEYCEKENLILIEDCCESLGAKKNGIKVGNFGIMGSFSFYFGHHMTTIEGGIIVTNDEEIADFLKSTRSHGWVRDSFRKGNYPEFKNKDFLFDIMGYNLRSTNMNAAIGISQLNRLNDFIKIRIQNHKTFTKIISDLKLKSQKINFEETSSFSLPILMKTMEQRDLLIDELKKEGIESRPIVAGNLIRQPVFRNRSLKSDQPLMANKIHDTGLYLPNNQFLNQDNIIFMVEKIKKILAK